MALNKEYFDSVNFELIKKKYYSAERVDALLRDIGGMAEAEHRDKAQLEAQLEALREQKNEIGDALLSAKRMANEITGRAQAQAEETLAAARTEADELLCRAREQAEQIIADAQAHADDELRAAEEQRQTILEGYQDQQEYAVKCVERCFDRLKQQQLDAVEMLKAEWRSFLSGLETPEYNSAPIDMITGPSDLEERIDAISKELAEICIEE